MRTLLAAACVISLTAPAVAEDAEAKLRADLFTNCHGVYHAMALLAGQGKYAKDAAANAMAKERFAQADKKAIDLVRDAYQANGDDAEDATSDLDHAAEQYVDDFDELTPGGAFNRAKMEEEVKSCDELMRGE